MPRVLVAMSGGVDSSVAALSLKEKGFDVIGITMRLFCYSGTETSPKSCCSTEAINDAKAVAEKLGIPHYVVDLEKEFEKEVIGDFVKEYLEGKTPNPCVRCNQVIKFGYLMDKAKEYDAEFLATGHYARIINNELYKGVDNSKDQSYFLYGIKKDYLSKILFPVGELEKIEVRRLAEERGLVTAKKPESQEICFIPDNNYPAFLKNRLDKMEVKSGAILDKLGKVVGEHKGLPFYTIGQRRGIDVPGTEVWYVISIDVKNNSLVIGKEEDLESREVKAVHLNWLADVGQAFKANAKIRYNMMEKSGKGELEDKKVRFIFEEPVRAVTPGQSIVFYDKDRVLGGGIIE
ncbi:TPA: tRNA 2-thiouridine(34) synthase MnmA [candidate division CPR2 bacterium]|uniref:tRNA-specific 2-thiouridylase MnmA n=1 Tax=candidate division CPR2 bacterium GW2011_GWC1_41_48 TaxID=1618344 RepID=A0A0G0W7T3_UNCC2|nr:MAG: tRNA-specific 2-thiouridylase MnmA 2 [candidate division CPR2 bacterium GW2011_GWC2_39_35]KKR28352.1 MAG: tRNA-specific 2-thiouridylase MnmA 2 [candidate division CPR2 bacterium GW2011_GWD2_39_7]KKR28383.1 MAG: tRNA-specific 2-thiouridylase MnmA 2 [candidate division CPR2 bacterium GW2011_GWD1_39_7]KKS09069.1 MAG: tRNA-specific 2-thiouridylase MnmA 2 [candidate division CPR2 bacterium GW2011_GWC1_41_48]OGB60591.1 MAG: tRNA 2-thiouridine(34) synthase MnmA [candidate division CPR2 bacteri